MRLLREETGQVREEMQELEEGIQQMREGCLEIAAELRAAVGGWGRLHASAPLDCRADVRLVRTPWGF
jgi:hypothetical protein